MRAWERDSFVGAFSPERILFFFACFFFFLRIHLHLFLDLFFLVNHLRRVSCFDQSQLAVIPLFSPTPRVHHVARPSFSPLPSLWFTFPCPYRNRRFPITCAKRGGNNNNASVSVRTPSVPLCRRSSQSQSIVFFSSLRTIITPNSNKSDPRRSAVPESFRTSTQPSITGPLPALSVGDFRTSLILPECVLISFCSLTHPSLNARCYSS